MINWDREMRRAHATKRLVKLPPAAQASFAAGTLQHATLHARATPSWRAPENLPLATALDRAFAFIWKHLGAASPPGATKALKTKLGRFSPDEDDPSIPGQGDLVDAMLQLISLGAEPKAKDVSSVASQAYQAITAIELPGVSGGGDAFLKAERACGPSVREIAFQLAYLDALEALGGGDVGWDSVLAHRSKKPGHPDQLTRLRHRPGVEDAFAALLSRDFPRGEGLALQSVGNAGEARGAREGVDEPSNADGEAISEGKRKQRRDPALLLVRALDRNQDYDPLDEVPERQPERHSRRCT